MQDDCKNFMCSAIHNETFWCGECAHVPALGQMTIMFFILSLGCKLCHSPPLCVIDYGGQNYYDVYRFQSMSRVAIHLDIHNHHVVNGKCWECQGDYKVDCIGGGLHA